MKKSIMSETVEKESETTEKGPTSPKEVETKDAETETETTTKEPKTKKAYKKQTSEVINIDEEAPTTKKVNRYKNEPLLCTYFVVDGKLYKKTATNKYRALKLQKTQGDYHYYYVINANGKSRTVNANNMKQLTYEEIHHNPEVEDAFITW